MADPPANSDDEADVALEALQMRYYGDTGRATPFASATYTVIGEPEGFDVRNTLAGNIGAQLLVSDASAVTVSYAYEEAASTAVANQQSIGLGIETDLSPRLRLGADARAGVSGDAPDARLGLRIGIGF